MYFDTRQAGTSGSCCHVEASGGLWPNIFQDSYFRLTGHKYQLHPLPQLSTLRISTVCLTPGSSN